MLTEEQATLRIREVFPDTELEITGPVNFNELYLFRVIDLSDPIEGGWDPFFSVNKETGEVRDFSIITDGDTEVILNLFQEVSK